MKNKKHFSEVKRTKSYPDQKEMRFKILVIQQKMIGDVLTSTIICEALRKKHPKATIHYLVNTNTIPVVLENPFFDHIIAFKNEYKTSKKAFYRFLKEIQNAKYDLVIDAYGKNESNLISLFSGASKKVSFYKWYTQWIYTKIVHIKINPVTNASVAVENRLRLVYTEEELPSKILRPQLFLTMEEKNMSKEFLTQHGISFSKPLLMISVLGSELKKTLPAPFMAKVIDRIAEQTGATILFNYIPNQEKEAKIIYDLTTKETQEHILFDVFGKGLRQFIAILYHCDALIGNEGGAVNMAKALDKPTFTIFSPWICKKDWNMFEDGLMHDSVHLYDYKPELYGDKTPKEMKEKSVELYQHFSPDLILPILDTYIKNQNF